MKNKTEIRKICEEAMAIIQKETETERAKIRIVGMEIKRVDRLQIYPRWN